MKHLLQFTPDGRIQPHWHPGTPWRERMRLAKAFRAFVDGIDPRDRTGFYRFDVDEDGNAIVGGRAEPPQHQARVVKWSRALSGGRS